MDSVNNSDDLFSFDGLPDDLFNLGDSPEESEDLQERIKDGLLRYTDLEIPVTMTFPESKGPEIAYHLESLEKRIKILSGRIYFKAITPSLIMHLFMPISEVKASGEFTFFGVDELNEFIGWLRIASVDYKIGEITPHFTIDQGAESMN